MMKKGVLDHDELRDRVLAELAGAGFNIENGLLRLPEGDLKEVARSLHSGQRDQVHLAARDHLERWEPVLRTYFASGHDIDPSNIAPKLVPVESDEQAALFRLATLQWSVPVSQGYGRRTRFLLLDDTNDKLIGILALGDPVFNLRVRDDVIGWDAEGRGRRLYNVFDAFVLGAVEPYRQLIGGKLVALAAVADETVSFLTEKYRGKKTTISGVVKESRPVLVTTSSSLGRSSLYNRLTFAGVKVFDSVGFTEGFGHFQFSSGLFDDLVGALPESKNGFAHRYGDGPNWRMRTLRAALENVGLRGDLLKHGIRREVFLAPLALGWRAFLRGDANSFQPLVRPLPEIGEYFIERWAKDRALRMPEYADWKYDTYDMFPILKR